MTRHRKNTPKQQARTELVGEAHKTDGSPSSRVPTTQYQHFIPRFILRRFQVGPVKCVFIVLLSTLHVDTRSEH
ncbi:uncharacterized protein EDB93DRAFT_1184124 [Suillus bovinus]|uniref:uncharacterized protein n=1 Tax=Suillus bovinus TaxID=48563 RepID=UPI001B87DCA6|nr:uncharacterized protein EDB93DRAFT_1184124 [Suillus bovinus]KAG2128647.1 hypothetical protein EDB93DRAFT_1184124 [Suillus bovinus]